MRRSPGWFNHRNSEVWWNYLRSAVSIIDTSAERHSHFVLFGRSLTLHLAVASLKNIGQANQPIRRSVESDQIGGLRSRDRAQKDIKRKKFHHREVLANHRSSDGSHLLFLGEPDEKLPEEKGFDWYVTPLNSGPAIKTEALMATRSANLTAPVSASSSSPPWMLLAPAWQPHGDALVFSARSGDSTNLWRIGI